ncbi:Gag protein [Paenibacillus sp. NAIST15-1]|nr:Gag protein [Paenibacillus sp. NAIST15-1]
MIDIKKCIGCSEFAHMDDMCQCEKTGFWICSNCDHLLKVTVNTEGEHVYILKD